MNQQDKVARQHRLRCLRLIWIGTTVSVFGARNGALEVMSRPSPSGSCQTCDPQEINFDVHYVLSPTMLMKVTNSILDQVDWWKVVANVGGKGTAMTYRDAFEQLLRTAVARLRSQGKAYHGRNRAGESGEENSGNGIFIEKDEDDSLCGLYQ